MQEHSECVVFAVHHRVHARDLQCMPDTSLNRKCLSIDVGRERCRALDITKFNGDGDLVDGDVRWPECGPRIVGIGTKLSACLSSASEKFAGVGRVIRPCR
jgi:hypothetical protein